MPSKQSFNYAVMLDGKTIGKRKSTHVYTHAVVLSSYHESLNGREYYKGSVWHYCGSKKSAEAKALYLDKRVEHVDNANFIVLPVVKQ